MKYNTGISNRFSGRICLYNFCVESCLETKLEAQNTKLKTMNSAGIDFLNTTGLLCSGVLKPSHAVHVGGSGVGLCFHGESCPYLNECGLNPDSFAQSIPLEGNTFIPWLGVNFLT